MRQRVVEASLALGAVALREGPLMRPYTQSQAGPVDFPITLDMEGLMKGLPVGPQS